MITKLRPSIPYVEGADNSIYYEIEKDNSGWFVTVSSYPDRKKEGYLDALGLLVSHKISFGTAQAALDKLLIAKPVTKKIEAFYIEMDKQLPQRCDAIFIIYRGPHTYTADANIGGHSVRLRRYGEYGIVPSISPQIYTTLDDAVFVLEEFVNGAHLYPNGTPCNVHNDRSCCVCHKRSVVTGPKCEAYCPDHAPKDMCFYEMMDWDKYAKAVQVWEIEIKDQPVYEMVVRFYSPASEVNRPPHELLLKHAYDADIRAYSIDKKIQPEYCI